METCLVGKGKVDHRRHVKVHFTFTEEGENGFVRVPVQEQSATAGFLLKIANFKMCAIF